MLFLGWISLVWTLGEAALMAEGRETDRPMDPHAHRCPRVGCRPSVTWAGTVLLGSQGQACPRTPPWRTQMTVSVTSPQLLHLGFLRAADPTLLVAPSGYGVRVPATSLRAETWAVPLSLSPKGLSVLGKLNVMPLSSWGFMRTKCNCGGRVPAPPGTRPGSQGRDC